MSALLNWYDLVYNFFMSRLGRVTCNLLWPEISQEGIEFTKGREYLRAYCPIHYILWVKVMGWWQIKLPPPMVMAKLVEFYCIPFSMSSCLFCFSLNMNLLLIIKDFYGYFVSQKIKTTFGHQYLWKLEYSEHNSWNFLNSELIKTVYHSWNSR